MNLTLEQVQQYLAAMGVALPDFVVQLLFDQASSIDECLLEHYDPATAALIKLYLISLLAIPQAIRYVSSESAPSGASRSYRYGQLRDNYRGQLGLLKALDKFGCADGLIPPDPTAANAGVWIGKGGCDCE